MTAEADALRAAMDASGITNDRLRDGIAAIAMGESALKGHTETGYGRTGDTRIRQVFGSRVAGLSDADIDTLKASDERFFEFVYGGAWGARNLGNVLAGDGYKYRGRGFLQLTGRGNYQRYATLLNLPALVDNPDLANDPATAALIAVAYMQDRYHGDGSDFGAMMQAVGNSTADIAATKTRLFEQFLASGEFAAGQSPAGAPIPAAGALAAAKSRPSREDVTGCVRTLQTMLQALGLYAGALDGDPGPATIWALDHFRHSG